MGTFYSSSDMRSLSHYGRPGQKKGQNVYSRPGMPDQPRVKQERVKRTSQWDRGFESSDRGDGRYDERDFGQDMARARSRERRAFNEHIAPMHEQVSFMSRVDDNTRRGRIDDTAANLYGENAARRTIDVPMEYLLRAQSDYYDRTPEQRRADIRRFNGINGSQDYAILAPNGVNIAQIDENAIGRTRTFSGGQPSNRRRVSPSASYQRNGTGRGNEMAARQAALSRAPGMSSAANSAEAARQAASNARRRTTARNLDNNAIRQQNLAATQAARAAGRSTTARNEALRAQAAREAAQRASNTSARQDTKMEEVRAANLARTQARASQRADRAMKNEANRANAAREAALRNQSNASTQASGDAGRAQAAREASQNASRSQHIRERQAAVNPRYQTQENLRAAHIRRMFRAPVYDSFGNRADHGDGRDRTLKPGQVVSKYPNYRRYQYGSRADETGYTWDEPAQKPRRQSNSRRR